MNFFVLVIYDCDTGDSFPGGKISLKLTARFKMLGHFQIFVSAPLFGVNIRFWYLWRPADSVCVVYYIHGTMAADFPRVNLRKKKLYWRRSDDVRWSHSRTLPKTDVYTSNTTHGRTTKIWKWPSILNLAVNKWHTISLTFWRTYINKALCQRCMPNLSFLRLFKFFGL